MCSPPSEISVEHSKSLLQGIENYISSIESEFNQVPEKRKIKLKELSNYVRSKDSLNEQSNLIFICTHNSRRSHMSQLWAQTAAYYYGVTNVRCFSGGTETTAFNPRSIKALSKAGFEIVQTEKGENPVYEIRYANDREPEKAFSKKIDDDPNPKNNFAAVMTCSDANEACPFVPGAAFRIAIPYIDPKEADNTPAEELIYDERCLQIAIEMFYVFSQV
jgi:protein-tyrosine-phosphatase